MSSRIVGSSVVSSTRSGARKGPVSFGGPSWTACIERIRTAAMRCRILEFYFSVPEKPRGRSQGPGSVPRVAVRQALLHCARRSDSAALEAWMATFGERVVGAMKLDANTFEEIERDPSAIG